MRWLHRPSLSAGVLALTIWLALANAALRAMDGWTCGDTVLPDCMVQ